MSCTPVTGTISEESDVKAALGQLTVMVDVLKKEVSELKETVAECSQKDTVKEKMTVMEAMMAQLKSKKQLKDYDWAAISNCLEAVLDHSSTTYRQLQSIPVNTASVLWEIGSKGYEKLATVLLVAGMNVNLPDGCGNTLLHGAAGRGHVKLVEMLLGLGANCEARNRYGNTPVIVAARDGHQKTVVCLKERGADVNVVGYQGWSCLHRVAKNGHLKLVRYLVESGANTRARDKAGRTPLDLARNMKHELVVQYLSRFPQ